MILFLIFIYFLFVRNRKPQPFRLSTVHGMPDTAEGLVTDCIFPLRFSCPGRKRGRLSPSRFRACQNQKVLAMILVFFKLNPAPGESRLHPVSTRPFASDILPTILFSFPVPAGPLWSRFRNARKDQPLKTAKRAPLCLSSAPLQQSPAALPSLHLSHQTRSCGARFRPAFRIISGRSLILRPVCTSSFSEAFLSSSFC